MSETLPHWNQMAQSKSALFKKFMNDALNKQQQKAALHDNGSILVVAGAGSGKTRVITARIAHLILNKNVQSHEIVALTFTNKAANEMKERIKEFVENPNDIPFIGTFHSYCVRLLKKNQELLDTPFFSILDSDDQKKLINGILQRNNLQKQLSARNVSYHISQVKNKLADPDQNVEELFSMPLLYEVYCEYEKEKTASKCLDFDDLLLTALQLFKKNKTFKKDFQARLKHVLVDEYQDTNVVQHALLKQMAKRSNTLAIDSICAVGDEDQSIYSWRGATIANMLNFKKDFPKTTMVKIEQNYRSVQPILDIANKVIEYNTQRNPKKLWSEKKGTDRIRMLTCMSEYQEADALCQCVITAHKKETKKSIAILYRTHAQSRAIEEALLKNSIPYKIIGGIQFYERKEVKDILAFLKLIVNPFDRTSLFRILNTPTRGLGKKFEQEFYELWHNEPFMNFLDVAKKMQEKEGKKKAESIGQFITIFDSFDAQSKPSAATKEIIKRSGYLTYLKNTYDTEDANTRIENLQELIEAMQHFEANKTETIEKFLEDVALMQEKMAASDDQQEKVLLMTLHAAKGLEFDTVLLAGLEHGILPSSRSLDEDNLLEEERRLFYVGITRAKERLLLTHAKFRYTYGQMVDQFPSQFLHEIPKKHMTKHDSSYWNTLQQRAFFSDWFGMHSTESVMTFSGSYHKNKTTTTTKKKIIKKASKLKKAKKPPKILAGNWKKNQPVLHEKYGTGLVQKVDDKGDGTFYITVKFKSGTKKIVNKFLSKV